MYIYTYVQQPMESQIESLPKVDIPARTVGSQLPQGYIRSPVAQWYGRGQRQEPGCRSPAQNGSRHGPEIGMPRASGKPGISVAIKKVFHMGIFRFPSGIITKKSNLPWLEDMVPTIKNWKMPRPPQKMGFHLFLPWWDKKSSGYFMTTKNAVLCRTVPVHPQWPLHNCLPRANQGTQRYKWSFKFLPTAGRSNWQSTSLMEKQVDFLAVATVFL